jgi:ATP-dependent Clp protease ATP-binding subunit ClpC
MNPLPNLKSLRAQKARISADITTSIRKVLWILAVLILAAAGYCFYASIPRIGYVAVAFADAIIILLLWYKYHLHKLPPSLPAKQLEDIIDPALLGRLKASLSPQRLWDIIMKLPEGQFMCDHLFLHSDTIKNNLSNAEADAAPVWRQAYGLVNHTQTPNLHAGTLLVALLLTSPGALQYLTFNKLRPEDTFEALNWLERQMELWNRPKPNFGGIGRDWAKGYTPTLEQFGQNISQSVQYSGGFRHYLAHADMLDGMVSNLERGASVALIAPDGGGKSTLVRALAERLLLGKDRELQYYQVFSLNASLILSYSGQQLERLMLTLFGEAVASGNMIIFLDDAQLFFGSGTGAFDMSQILLPVLKSRNVRIIAAFDPRDWQHMQATHQSLTTGFASITLTDLPQEEVYKVIEDNTMQLERRNGVLITFEAIIEAYRLSGQYMQEQAYPGKAINLLEQSIPYAQERVITRDTVQAAVEKTKGVKVSVAAAPEAEMLLNLEDRIHERMINQVRAVNDVAAALRRGRAGVSSPNRPVGSFLFLGPTGVGKTELARSLAAVYFGDEHQMIRLDMSEYQRPEDVTRLLSGGSQTERSLLSAIREQPFAVVLLDEIEKAHPNILNLLLQMLDEGQLTDEQGRPASFRSSIIIATSNAGAADITQHVREKGTLEDFERPLIDKLIAAGQFKPELINRFDEVVLFRPLNEEELAQVAQVMLKGVNQTLSVQQLTVRLTPEALKTIVHQGYDPEFGARPMRRIIQKTVENAVAMKILRGQAQPGSIITLDIPDLTQGGQATAQPGSTPAPASQPAQTPSPSVPPQPPATTPPAPPSAPTPPQPPTTGPYPG